jgi:hypothetical protein
MTHRTITIRYNADKWIYPWVATYDNYDGPESPVGTGTTETDALEMLLNAEFNSGLNMSARVSRIEQALAFRVIKLERALEFYANPENYTGHRNSDASVHIETSAIDTDGGQRACEVLWNIES